MGVAIMAAGTDASAYANNYIPPVSGPLAWANLESDALPSARRLKNFGSLGGSFVLSGIAQLASIGVTAAAGTDSRLTLGSFINQDKYTVIALVDVGTDASILRHRNIRISTNSSKKLQRVMDSGTSVSDITAPSSGAFVVFLNGDSTGHAFGILTASGIQKSTSSAANSGTTSTWIGGSNLAGAAAAWAGYGAAVYDRKLSDSEMESVADRLIKRARYLGVTVNG
ncbi:hypothetical protein DA718_12820 [Klebsiella huaxiensis]|uniref:Uncharacterized protein n=1 Tax=Klebsiella huaxiensis TaxID=2153354 RepID=A0ABT6EGL7_9ENTR|nr:hypothetical protein [Klebsiella huaxiensis]MDG1643684.1 hypothetical protein [Klebsiella huaxiensis]QBG08013.1 hypothetical protein DA718_12820 [Klebsiella huaxiensis]